MTAHRKRSIQASLSSLFLWCVIATAAAQPVPLQVVSATPALDQRTGEPIVSFQLTDASRKTFAEFTAKNIGRPMAIRIDGKLISKPVIREPILGGAGQLSGMFTAEETKTLAERLLAGKARLEIEAE
jgi:preprotein translocase subunit SecD